MAQDSENDAGADSVGNHLLTVYFLYGSRPAAAFRKEEKAWFGGIHGGHVGLGLENERILSFFRKGRMHVFSSRRRRIGVFCYLNETGFWGFHGGEPELMQRLTIQIPVTATQAERFRDIADRYTSDAPYDYAFLGMRCAAAAYDMLAQTGLLPSLTRFATIARYFYPRLLRKKLRALAAIYRWKSRFFAGTDRRKWEND